MKSDHFKPSPEDARFILEHLRRVVNFEAELPGNVFNRHGYNFWFFDRPILTSPGLIVETASIINNNGAREFFLKYAGDDARYSSIFMCQVSQASDFMEFITAKERNLFDGDFAFPLVIFNKQMDWIFFEDATEEYGVLGVLETASNRRVCEFLDSHFITMSDFICLADSPRADAKTAQEFIKSYGKPSSFGFRR